MVSAGYVTLFSYIFNSLVTEGRRAGGRRGEEGKEGKGAEREVEEPAAAAEAGVAAAGRAEAGSEEAATASGCSAAGAERLREEREEAGSAAAATEAEEAKARARTSPGSPEGRCPARTCSPSSWALRPRTRCCSAAIPTARLACPRTSPRLAGTSCTAARAARQATEEAGPWAGEEARAEGVEAARRRASQTGTALRT